LRGADAYIVIASLLALCKFLYNFTTLMLTQDDVVVDKFVKRYMPRSCRPKKKAAMFDFQQQKADEPPPGMLAEGAFECQVGWSEGRLERSDSKITTASLHN